MSLLDQETKKEESRGKKVILLLLIFSVFALIMVIIMMMALSGKQTKELSISINGEDIKIEEGLLTTSDDGVNYISIQKIAKKLGYNYLTGEYKQYNEDTTNTKFYLESSDQIIQFEAGNKEIYKIDPTLNLDYEEYKLNNIILKQNDLLYISLEDISIALNTLYTYSQSDNKILLNTTEDLYTKYSANLSNQTNNNLTGLSDNFNNKKAIAYDMLIVSNESGKWGVVKASDYSTIIGNKYSSIEFIESANAFIVSDNNKYGVIVVKEELATNLIIDLKFERIRVINNNPLCYEVKIGENIAILNKEGKLISNNAYYNSVGYESSNTTEESVLVIKNFGTSKDNLLVVCKDKKYGLVNLDNGSSIGDCILDKIYSKTENGEKVYYIQLNEQEILLDKYLEYINTTTVNIVQ